NRPRNSATSGSPSPRSSFTISSAAGEIPDIPAPRLTLLLMFAYPRRALLDRSCPQESRANLRGGIATPQGVRVRRSHPAVAPPPPRPYLTTFGHGNQRRGRSSGPHRGTEGRRADHPHRPHAVRRLRGLHGGRAGRLRVR